MLSKYGVAPLAGAWIEIFNCQVTLQPVVVAPLAGAWIEIEQKGDGEND